MTRLFKTTLLGAAAIPVIALAVTTCSSAATNGQESPPTAKTADLAAPSADQSRPAEMFSIVLKLTDDGLETLQVDRVKNTLNRRDPDRREPTFYRIFDRNGAVIFERGFRLQTERRLETADENGKLSGARVEVDEPVFTIKVPAFDGLDVVRLFRGVQGEARENAELLGEVRP